MIIKNLHNDDKMFQSIKSSIRLLIFCIYYHICTLSLIKVGHQFTSLSERQYKCYIQITIRVYTNYNKSLWWSTLNSCALFFSTCINESFAVVILRSHIRSTIQSSKLNFGRTLSQSVIFPSMYRHRPTLASQTSVQIRRSISDGLILTMAETS